MWLEETAPDTYARLFPRQADPDDTGTPRWQRDAMERLPEALSFNAWVGLQTCARIDETPFFGIAGFVVGQDLGASGPLSETLDRRALGQADAALGSILNALPEDTVVVLTAGRGSGADPAAPLAEAAIKVPLALRTKDRAGRAVPEAISTMDVAPTLYARAGVRPPPRLQGRDLLSDVPRGWALSRLRHPDHPQRTALVMEGCKLVMTHGADDRPRLYRLQVDPGEASDLSADPAHQDLLEDTLDRTIDARVALEDRTEPRIAKV